MRYETWAPSSTMTMDELKLLSIPSEMLRFFNHFSFPHKGRPTRSMHPPMDIDNIRHMNVGTIKYDDHGQIKAPKHPRSECLDSLTTLVPHEWVVQQGQCTPPWTYTTCTCQCIPNINNIPFQCHSQHKHHLISMTLSTTITTSFCIHIIIININITTYQLKSLIDLSIVSCILHIHIFFMPEIHTFQVFKQHKSNRDNNFIHQQ